MSERIQRTAASMREKMLQRYGDEMHHKHDKNHNEYRQHYRSHPVVQRSLEEIMGEQDTNTSTGIIREVRLRKFRKRLAKTPIH
jgi:hypothetical protein